MQETQEMWVQSLGQEDHLEKEMATHSSILVWKIPWTEEPGGLQSMGSQRVRHNWEHTHTHYLDIPQFIYALIYSKISWLFPSVINYEWSCYKHLCAGFCVEVSFQFPWVDAKECDCWITLLYSKNIVSFVRNCQSESVSHLLGLTLVTPWTIAHQAPLSVKFSRQEYWRLPFPSPGYLPDPGIKPGSPALQADSSPSEPPSKINCHTVFQGSCTHLHSHQQWIRAPVAPHPPQHLVLREFCILVILIGVCWVSLFFQFLPLSTSPPPPFLTIANLFKKSHGIWELSSRWHKLSNIRHMIEGKTAKGLAQVTWEPWEEE